MAHPHGIPAHELTEEEEARYEAMEAASTGDAKYRDVEHEHYTIGIDMAGGAERSNMVILDKFGVVVTDCNDPHFGLPPIECNDDMLYDPDIKGKPV